MSARSADYVKRDKDGNVLIPESMTVGEFMDIVKENKIPEDAFIIVWDPSYGCQILVAMD